MIGSRAGLRPILNIYYPFNNNLQTKNLHLPPNYYPLSVVMRHFRERSCRSMMFMSNKVLLDSSLLIEYRKGNQTDLLDEIVQNPHWKPAICQIVVSEYLFFHLAVFSGKAPLSVKMSGEISKYLSKGAPEDFLNLFEWLADVPGIHSLAIQMMMKYQLLPNDALILSVCKVYGINYLASFDPDFKTACTGEGLQLISTLEDFVSFNT